MLVFRPTAIIASLVLGAAFATPVHAQAPAATCSVEEGKPSEVARAYLAISQVAGDQTLTLEQKKERVTKAIHALTSLPKDADNPVGRNYELGKLLVLWTTFSGTQLTATRGTLGYATDTAATINLPAAIDSAFDVVETSNPECAEQVLRWRSQNGWINLVNQSIQELNAGSFDSADAHARETLLFNDKAPYGYMVLGQVAERRQQPDSAIALFQKTLTAAGSDSTYASLRQQIQLSLGNLAASAAVAEQDSTKKLAYDRIAKPNLEAVAGDTTANATARESAKSALVSVNLALGDSASAKAAYAAQLQDPSQFTFREVLQAGVAASQLGDDSAALKLFHAAYDDNPYHRDAITNLMIFELRAERYDSAVVLLNRLQEIDPNGNNSRLIVPTYAGMAKHFQDLNKEYEDRSAKAKGAKAKKALEDSAKVASDSATVYTDLALRANVHADSIPVLVSFTQFSNVRDTVTLSGMIENRTPEARTYTMKVDFLDSTGAVIASQTQSVGPVGAQESGRFTMTVAAAGVTAFKYAPLDR